MLQMLTQAQNTAGYISGQSALAHQKTQNQRPWFLPRLSLTHPVLGLTAPQILQPTALSFVDIVRVRFRDNLAVYHEFVQSLAQLSTRGKNEAKMWEVVQTVHRLFENHSDLWYQFQGFVPKVLLDKL